MCLLPTLTHGITACVCAEEREEMSKYWWIVNVIL
jgi:hypothetical protein